MEMPKIKKCDAKECAYNKEQTCHAMAVTIGDKQSHPRCDTFIAMTQKAGDSSTTGCIGACRASQCQHNESLECRASSIEVGAHKAHDWDCKTFSKKEQQSQSRSQSRQEAW
jgi:hypothetical protein